MSALRYTIIDNTSGTPVSTVIAEPVGLDAVTLHLGRDKQYHGFFDQINDTLGSLKYYSGSDGALPGGYSVLRAAYNSYGIDADVQLLIEFACSDTDTYQTLYRGRFNFSKYKETQGNEGCYIEMGVENGNWLIWFKNRMDHHIALDSLQTFDLGYGTLPPYAGLGMQIVLPPKTIKELDHAVYNYVPSFYSQP